MPDGSDLTQTLAQVFTSFYTRLKKYKFARVFLRIFISLSKSLSYEY